MKRYAIILAAGKGSRMKSKRDDISKVSMPILGVPVIKYILDALKPIDCEKTISVLGFGGQSSEKIVKGESDIVWQKEQKGSGHAVMMAAPLLEGKEGETIVCCGDTPLLKSETLEKMFLFHEESGSDLTVMSFIPDNPFGYGRIVKDNEGRFLRIVEQKDANEEEQKIQEVNAGVYIFNNRVLFESLKKITTKNAAGEYYLTDVIDIFVRGGLKAFSFIVDDPSETMGINDRVQLSVASKTLQRRINKRWMLNGVSIDDPDNTYISPYCQIGADTIIHPNTFLYGSTEVGENAELGPNSYFENAEIAANTRVRGGEYVKIKVE